MVDGLLGSFCRLPTASALPGLSREMVTRADGTVLNTCSTDALVEMLRFLKRAYWPFGWQSGRGPLAGGFISAAIVSSCQQHPQNSLPVHL